MDIVTDNLRKEDFWLMVFEDAETVDEGDMTVDLEAKLEDWLGAKLMEGRLERCSLERDPEDIPVILELGRTLGSERRLEMAMALLELCPDGIEADEETVVIACELESLHGIEENGNEVTATD